ncbi:MAG: hypothetical protein AB4050_10970 [Synechococcus sp.]
MDGDEGRYAIVGGNGRSGSNWVLQLFDASPETHCRSEPVFLKGSPFQKIRPHLYSLLDEDVDVVSNQWSELVTWASGHAGIRDHPVVSQKNHVHSLAVLLGLAQVPYRPTARRALATVLPRFQVDEFVLPWWIWRSKKVKDAFLVLKFHFLAHHAEPILTADEKARFVHNVRHPGGYINSLSRRFFSRLDESTKNKWCSETIEQLTRLLARNVKRAKLVPNPKSLDHIEAALWLWRFTNEDLLSSCRSKTNYKLLVYEDAILDPILSARELYEFCDLEWSKKIEHQLYKKSTWSVFDGQLNNSADRSSLWKQQLQPSSISTVEKVLEGSSLQYLWKK